jgi:hypothetical protein
MAKRALHRLSLALACLAFNASALAADPSPANLPKALSAQVQRLTDLLRDEQAVIYPQATLVQTLSRPDGQALTLVVFTLEGFGGGNNHTQYLAVFSPGKASKSGPAHFQLLDVLPIGGKGWRAVTKLDARLSAGSAADGGIAIALDALEVSASDPPNFPSKKATVQLLLKSGRLTELR